MDAFERRLGCDDGYNSGLPMGGRQPSTDTNGAALGGRSTHRGTHLHDAAFHLRNAQRSVLLLLRLITVL